MPANEGHSEFDACCRLGVYGLQVNHLLSVFGQKTDAKRLQKHADFRIVAFVSPSREVSAFTILLAKKETYLETSAADREILLPDLFDMVDVALKSKHKENEAYLSERPLAKHTMKSKLLKDLTESDRIVGELLQLGGYLKLIEFGLDDCVDGIEA
ncbi:squalene monooxygenase-like protein [Tanacetum coccineum]|uniref:Squalene monooxygenase n=1 Tax=Tanacetum coccineum TaxID=301880 RepID=A0ABQ4ZK74_9ASTR